MAHRTTLLLDDEARKASKQLASAYGCSASEAIRRAIIGHRDAVLGIPASSRDQRRRVLKRLFELFDGHDADEEIARLKREDTGF